MKSTQFILIFVLGISIQCSIASTTKLNNPTDKIPTTSAFDEKKKCECGIFDTKAPIKFQKPIINPTFAADTCDRIITCIRFCYTILNGMGGRILDLLCTVVGHYTNLVPHVHIRVCGAERWFFAGTIIDKGICCQDSKFIDCRNQTENIFVPDDPLA